MTPEDIIVQDLHKSQAQSTENNKSLLKDKIPNEQETSVPPQAGEPIEGNGDLLKDKTADGHMTSAAPEASKSVQGDKNSLKDKTSDEHEAGVVPQVGKPVATDLGSEGLHDDKGNDSRPLARQTFHVIMNH